VKTEKLKRHNQATVMFSGEMDVYGNKELHTVMFELWDDGSVRWNLHGTQNIIPLAPSYTETPNNVS